MMLGEYLVRKIFEKVLTNSNFTVTVPYFSLHTADPGITGANELTAGSEGGSYARQPCGVWDTAIPRRNNAELLWLNTPYAVVTHVGMWDAATGGNFLWGDALAIPIRLFLGERARFNQNRLTVYVGRGFSDYLIPKILDKILKNTDFTVSAVYGSIHKGDLDGDGSNEQAGGAGRPVITPTGWDTDPTQAGSTWNIFWGNPDTGVVVWTTLPAVTISEFGLWDASSGGNFLMGHPLTTSVVLTGGSSEIAINQFDHIFASMTAV